MIDISAGRTNMADVIKRAVKAHAAVAEGIATHADMVRIERESKAEQLALTQKLSQPTGGIEY